ncbi:hypothetical protein FA15DRAFT_757505 [Coprinopsis marcescibilis]|uniref:Uncharacterized protein n=1 Tax=Coprinopsis marcescibilis TaxID=230819 RepID=A0A5C3KS74_COPMA|nr:hypothetical protein FA15DRAFT_757505 [Coprinopsis marcescibilis]
MHIQHTTTTIQHLAILLALGATAFSSPVPPRALSDNISADKASSISSTSASGSHPAVAGARQPSRIYSRTYIASRDESAADSLEIDLIPQAVGTLFSRDLFDLKVNTLPLSNNRRQEGGDSDTPAEDSDPTANDTAVEYGDVSPDEPAAAAQDGTLVESPDTAETDDRSLQSNVVLHGTDIGRRSKRDLFDLKVNTRPLDTPSEADGNRDHEPRGVPQTSRQPTAPHLHREIDNADTFVLGLDPRPALHIRAPDSSLLENVANGNSYSGAAGNAAGGSVTAPNPPPGAKGNTGLLGSLSPASGGSLVSLFSGNAGQGGSASSGNAQGASGKLPSGLPGLPGPAGRKTTTKKTTGPDGKVVTTITTIADTGNTNTVVNQSVGNAFSGAAGNAAGGNVQAMPSLIDLFSHNAGNGGQANTGVSRAQRRSLAPPLSNSSARLSGRSSRKSRASTDDATSLDVASGHPMSMPHIHPRPHPARNTMKRTPQTGPSLPVNPYPMVPRAQAARQARRAMEYGSWPRPDLSKIRSKVRRRAGEMGVVLPEDYFGGAKGVPVVSPVDGEGHGLGIGSLSRVSFMSVMRVAAVKVWEGVGGGVGWWGRGASLVGSEVGNAGTWNRNETSVGVGGVDTDTDGSGAGLTRQDPKVTTTPYATVTSPAFSLARPVPYTVGSCIPAQVRKWVGGVRVRVLNRMRVLAGRFGAARGRM